MKSKIKLLPALNFGLNSLSSLILTGFILAGLPLIWALWSSMQSVNMLTTLSQQTVMKTTKITQNSKRLAENLLVMERSLRQYLVLKDKELLQSYYDERGVFLKTVHTLQGLALSKELSGTLNVIQQQENKIFVEVKQANDKTIDKDLLVTRFADINAGAHTFEKNRVRWVNKQSSLLKQTATDVQKETLTNVSLLVPIFLLLVILFTYLIARPIKKLERSIGYLSKGALNKKIEIQGPADIESLGSQLDLLRRKLAKLEDDQTKFLQQVSHELKTPLASINEGTGLLVDEVVGVLNGEQADIVAIMQKSSVQLKGQINTLLEFSRLNAQKNSLHLEPVNLNELIQEVIARQQILLKSKNLQVRLDCPSLNVNLDKKKFSMVLDNLLSNAIKYSEKAGEIAFAASVKQNQLVMALIDNGCGLQEGEEHKVFDLFFQGWGAKAFGVHGSGLGLAIAKDIVEAHSGSIRVDTSYQQGAKFIIVLPMEFS